jgi:hypothetical protein
MGTLPCSKFHSKVQCTLVLSRKIFEWHNGYPRVPEQRRQVTRLLVELTLLKVRADRQ